MNKIIIYLKRQMFVRGMRNTDSETIRILKNISDEDLKRYLNEGDMVQFTKYLDQKP